MLKDTTTPATADNISSNNMLIEMNNQGISTHTSNKKDIESVDQKKNNDDFDWDDSSDNNEDEYNRLINDIRDDNKLIDNNINKKQTATAL